MELRLAVASLGLVKLKYQAGRSAGGPTGQSVGWSAGWLAGRPTGRPAGLDLGEEGSWQRGVLVARLTIFVFLALDSALVPSIRGGAPPHRVNFFEGGPFDERILIFNTILDPVCNNN